MDEKMMPVRGQTVLVRNVADIMATNSGTDDGEDEVCYVMQRAAGNNAKTTVRICCFLMKVRGWNASGGLLSERELGFSDRLHPREPNHEEGSRSLPFSYCWEGY